ncbi:MAG: S8 family serine peptidase, partial [Bacteroidales bacterium]|nr:S8 family serine peptidase [Bacteroidales bacterium]
MQSILNSTGVPYVSFHQDEYNPAKYTVSLISDSTIYYAQRLYETGCFVFSEPNFYGEAEIYGLEDNPAFYDQWAIHNDSVNINLLPAWNITHGDAKVKIALLDCGVDLDHSDLVDNLEHGYDAVNSDVYQVSAENGMYESANDWHGTACAGVISSLNNEECGVGIAFGSRLVPIRISFIYVSHTNKEQNPPADDDIIYIQVWNNGWFIDAMNHACYIDKADIISCSFGLSQPSDAVESKIAEVCTTGRDGKGMIMVAASGNTRNNNVLSDTLKYIAKHPSVISVGSVSPCGKRVKMDENCVVAPDYNSCYGDSLDVVAPGLLIPTTQIESDCYNSFSGTSSAAPHVAGVAALVLSVNPCLTREEVTYILESTCTKVRPDVYNYGNSPNHPNGTWNIEVGHGLVNAYEAVLLAQQMGGYVFRSQTEIQSNTLWDTASLINDDLIIDSLATLTITDTLFIAGGHRIIVRPGGKLIVNGGTLTSACDGEMWQGIIVEGNANIRQAALAQGSVILTNATIEN